MTARLKQVPPERSLRAALREQAVRQAAELPGNQPLRRAAIERAARQALADLDMLECYLGWTMVAVASAYWRSQITRVPFHRRLLLLPHCMRNESVCEAPYDAQGLHCLGCGGCNLNSLRSEAEHLGYEVLIAEGSPVVMRMILAGQTDAILGVACLNTLEKSLEKILTAGVPCMAVPLLKDGCRETSADVDWIREMIHTPYRDGCTDTPTYLHLMRAAASFFTADRLSQLLPLVASVPPDLPAPAEDAENPLALDTEDAAEEIEATPPLESTEAVALRFLMQGGKFYRPFITLAAYDATSGEKALRGGAAPPDTTVPKFVQQIALAVEVFHKASLVHDDIEDDDPYRYGRPAIHRRWGVPFAVNVGDYLIGLGYRLIAEQSGQLSGASVDELTQVFSRAHMQLCRGQGAELAWRRSPCRLPPVDVLKMYALKTSPAFEAALAAGVHLGRDQINRKDHLARFARHLGVAFQIQNDLDDWAADPHNKRIPGGDVLDGKPTLLWALACHASEDHDDHRRDFLIEPTTTRNEHDRLFLLGELRRWYEVSGAFAQAVSLLEKHRARALEEAATVEHRPLRGLLEYFADSLLRRRDC